LISSDYLDGILKTWMEQKPAGKLMSLYRQAMERAGREIGDL